MFSSQSNQDYKMGMILTKCSFVSPEDLEQGLQFAGIAGIPLGKALVFMNITSEQMIDDVLKAQEMVRNEMLTQSQARFVLQTANIFKIPYCQALQVSYLDPNDADSIKFGNILKILGVSPFKIKLALKIAKSSGKKLGDVAVKLGVISEQMQKNTVRIQESMRKLNSPIIERPAVEKEMRMRLGDLLVEAGCVKREVLEKALAEKGTSNLPVGSFLLEKNLICISLLNYALSLLSFVKKGRISSQFACQSLKNFSSVQSSYNIFDFLKACNFLANEDEEKLVSMLDQNASIFSQLLKSLTSKEMAAYFDSQMLLNLAFRNMEAMRVLLYEYKPGNKDLIDSALVFYSLAQGKKMTLNQALLNFTIRTNQIAMAEAKSA